MRLKTCIKCKKEKSAACFRKGKESKYRRPECSDCEKSYKKDYLKVKKGTVTPPLGTKCDCCGSKEKKLIMDHCHKTNTFRGFICHGCNLGIGRLGDTLQGIMKAIKYLSK